MPKELSTPRGKRHVDEFVTNGLPPVRTRAPCPSACIILPGGIGRPGLQASSLQLPSSRVLLNSPGKAAQESFLKLEVYCEPCANIGVPQDPFKLFEVDPARVHIGVLFLHFQEGLVDDLPELVLVEVLGDLKPKTPGTQPSDCKHQHDPD